MGGASSGISAAVEAASDAELQDCIKGMTEGSRNKIMAALSGKGGIDAAKIISQIKAARVSNPDNLTAKCFDEAYYNTLPDGQKTDLLRCVRSGAENPDSGCGCYAMFPEDYDRFKPFFEAILMGYHKVPKDTKHVNDWDLSGAEGLPADGKLDLAALGYGECSMRVRVGRNLASFPLPGAMTADDRRNMETLMCQAFEALKKENGGGYNSLTPGHPNFVDDAKYKELVAKHFMFKDMADDPYLASAGIASDWPIGRGCYISGDEQFIIWVGEEDHLRIMCMKKGTILNEVFDRLKKSLDMVEKFDGLKFFKSDQFGYVTSCPTNLGTGMRASLHVKVPKLTADGTDKKAKEICKPLGLSVRGLGGEHTPIGKDGTIDLSPSARFNIKEKEIIVALYKGADNVKKAEDAA
jgi:creatine kinase